MSAQVPKTHVISVDYLNGQLISLQELSDVLNNDFIVWNKKTIELNRRNYTNISKIYVWWRIASTIENYLEDLYAKRVTVQVNKDKNGSLNFKKLLYLMYGNEAHKDTIYRKNYVLVSIHKESVVSG